MLLSLFCLRFRECDEASCGVGLGCDADGSYGYRFKFRSLASYRERACMPLVSPDVSGSQFASYLCIFASNN